MDALKGLPELYGQALAEVAAEQGRLEAVVHDLESARDAFATRDLEVFFGNPLVPRQAKSDLIDRIFSLGTTDIFRIFLKVAVNRRRGRLLKEIVRSALYQCLARRGVDVVFVTTPNPLTGDQEEAVSQRLTEAFGVPIYPEFGVDPHLLGGIVIQRGDRVMDGSVLGILRQIGEALADGVPTEQG